MSKISLATGLSLSLGLGSLLAIAQAPPAADTFVYSPLPGQNFGKYPLLLVQNGATAYIQFNLSALPANASINKAVLRLYVDSVGKPEASMPSKSTAPGPKPASQPTVRLPSAPPRPAAIRRP